MTDDLIKRLWKHDMRPESVTRQAADRIEELEPQLAEALNQLDSTRHSVDVLERRVGELKAKLKGTNK